MKTWLKVALDWAIPSTCALCQVSAKRSRNLCFACEQDLPLLGHACEFCGQPLPQQADKAIPYCGGCIKKPPPYHRLIAPYRYQWPIEPLVLGLKFHQQLLYAELLGQLLADHVQNLWQQDYCLPECLIPVPLHESRLRERGYNQAIEIAKVAAQRFAIPIDRQSCKRHRATLAQSSLPAKQRRSNVSNAFSITQANLPKHVAIVDDVITTGQTVLALSRNLKQAGVECVEVWCVAKSLLD